MLKYIATTRFNNETWDENQQYIKKMEIMEKMEKMEKIEIQSSVKKIKCIYPVSEINCNLPQQTVFFVLEMNNEINKIMGIGLVKNTPVYNKYKVYKNPIYNQFAFVGYYRIDRSEMDETEEIIMRVFDYFCFKGNSHLKRLKGIKIFPCKILDKCNNIMNLLEFVSQMFRKRSNIISQKQS